MPYETFNNPMCRYQHPSSVGKERHIQFEDQGPEHPAYKVISYSLHSPQKKKNCVQRLKFIPEESLAEQEVKSTVKINEPSLYINYTKYEKLRCCKYLLPIKIIKLCQHVINSNFASISPDETSGTPATCLTCEDVLTANQYSTTLALMDHSEEPALNMETSLVQLEKVRTI